MVVKVLYIDYKNLKYVVVNVLHVCVVHFRVYVSRESNVESLCLVRLGFSFLVSWLYICGYNVSMSICFSVIFYKVLLFLSLNDLLYIHWMVILPKFNGHGLEDDSSFVVCI